MTGDESMMNAVPFADGAAGTDELDDQPYYGDDEPEGSTVVAGDRFDPCCCCDETERLVIAAMRAYLRPLAAPTSLYDRLQAALDRCVEEQAAVARAAGQPGLPVTQVTATGATSVTTVTSSTTVTDDGVVRTTIVHRQY
ncbi:hypothetical protein [Bifidobacterium choloepi]|uniref:Uncharacterized protein n=1 Tax=Bifidobacterium choloepi TaxID=2614131 RepID=A0A6I5N0H8_9BIFI|nr:hypothetical protein [Bifidobacterium choloepi]NEG70077.1 hypothetical protein [Bifidobacterium choloepi]